MKLNRSINLIDLVDPMKVTIIFFFNFKLQILWWKLLQNMCHVSKKTLVKCIARNFYICEMTHFGKNIDLIEIKSLKSLLHDGKVVKCNFHIMLLSLHKMSFD
jgi:hypothetical protein